jgi:thiol:disulfide interchange protein
MNSRGIAILGAIILGVLVVRFFVLAHYRSSHPLSGSPEKTSTLAAAPLKAAAAQADAEHKFLVVDAKAQWCGPCKAMERDSWPNADVVAWVKANAVFAQVDVDDDEAAAQSLGIEAMPTIIVFKDGRELKRQVGYMDAPELLAWLKSE